MKLVTSEVHGFEFGVCDPDLVRVGAVVEPSVDLEPRAAGGGGDEVDDRFQRNERLAAPVDRDEREQAVFDLG